MSSAHVDHHRKNIDHAIDFLLEHVNGQNYRIYYMIDHDLLLFIWIIISICMFREVKTKRMNMLLFSMGGFEGFKRTTRLYLNTIERYSIEYDQWEVFSKEGPQLSSLAACDHQNSIFLGGGKNGQW